MHKEGHRKLCVGLFTCETMRYPAVLCTSLQCAPEQIWACKCGIDFIS